MGGGGESPSAAILPVLLRYWGPSSANLYQKRTVNTIVKKSHKMKNGKGVIGEDFGFWLRRLGQPLSVIFGSLVDPLASIWAWRDSGSNSKQKEKILPFSASAVASMQ